MSTSGNNVMDPIVEKMVSDYNQRTKERYEKDKKEIDALKDINAPIFSNGNTILLEFAEGSTGHYSSPDILNYLISKGANVNAKNKDGNTALMLIFKDADTIPFVESYSILLNAPGLDINATNNKGSTAANFFDREIYNSFSGLVNLLKDFTTKKGVKLKFGTPVISKDETINLARRAGRSDSRPNSLILERVGQHPIYTEAGKAYMEEVSKKLASLSTPTISQPIGLAGFITNKTGKARKLRKHSKKSRGTRRH